MTQKITWTEPDDVTVTDVEIYRSSTIYGAYTLIDTIDATSDGLVKSISNTWVVTYTDSSGLRTYWYKLRFYNGSDYSDFTQPVTAQEEVMLCTVDEVKRTIDTVGRFTDTEIVEAIQEVEKDLIDEVGTPIQEIYSLTGRDSEGNLLDTYFVGEENIHRVDRLFYGTTTKYEYFEDDGFKTNVKYGMVRFLPVASGGPVLTEDSDVIIRYAPKTYSRVCLYRACKQLLEKIDYLAKGTASKELMVIEAKLEKAESILNGRVGLRLSSDFRNYNPVYGVNRKKIEQDHDRNRYIASTGW